MSKKNKLVELKPQGIMSFTNFLSDRGGVGHIRTIFPFTIIGA